MPVHSCGKNLIVILSWVIIATQVDGYCKLPEMYNGTWRFRESPSVSVVFEVDSQAGRWGYKSCQQITLHTHFNDTGIDATILLYSLNPTTGAPCWQCANVIHRSEAVLLFRIWQCKTQTDVKLCPALGGWPPMTEMTRLPSQIIASTTAPTTSTLTTAPSTTTTTSTTSTTSTPSVTTPWTLDGLTIISSVPEIVPSVTSHVMVKCSFTKRSPSESVMSLIVSQRDRNLGVFYETVSINAFSPSKPSVIRDIGAQLDGALNQGGESFLSLAWSYPGRTVATDYRCEVTTMDDTGHSAKWTVATHIQLRPMDIASLAEALRRTKKEFSDSMLRVHDERFHESNVTIDGHRMYWSVEGANFTFELAKMNCAITGGKVAEISQNLLNAKASELKEAGMEPGINYWIGVTNPGPASSVSGFQRGWVFNSTRVRTSVSWSRVDNSYYRCAVFRVDNTGYTKASCWGKARVLCQL